MAESYLAISRCYYGIDDSGDITTETALKRLRKIIINTTSGVLRTRASRLSNDIIYADQVAPKAGTR